MFADSISWMIFIFDGFANGQINKIKMAGVMHEADHTYSIRSTWWLHRLATDVPFIARVINLPCTFTQYLDLSSY